MHPTENSGFSIEQNEARIVVKFLSKIDTPIEMTIVDLLGSKANHHQCEHPTFTEYTTTIDISGLSTGLYFLNITYKGEHKSCKVVR